MDDFETTMDEAVKRGLVGLTLYRTQDDRWQAATTFDRLSWQHQFGDNPLEAVINALTAIWRKPAPEEDIFG